MACKKCTNHFDREIRDRYYSFSLNSSISRGRSTTAICPFCGQKWWAYNDHFDLWTTVDDMETFKNILDGCPEPVIISRPAETMKW